MDLVSTLICPQCHFLFQEPHQLNCGHTICHDCALQLLDERQFDCPICKQKQIYRSIDDIPHNNKMKDVVGELLLLNQSDSYFQQIEQTYPFLFDLTLNEIVSQGEGISRAMKGNEIKTIIEAVSTIRPRIEGKINELKYFLPSLERQLNSTRISKKQLNSSFQRTQLEIKNAFQQLHQLLDLRQKQLENESKNAFDVSSNQLSIVSTELTKLIQLAVQSDNNKRDIIQSHSLKLCEQYLTIQRAIAKLKNSVRTDIKSHLLPETKIFQKFEIPQTTEAQFLNIGNFLVTTDYETKVNVVQAFYQVQPVGVLYDLENIRSIERQPNIDGVQILNDAVSDCQFEQIPHNGVIQQILPKAANIDLLDTELALKTIAVHDIQSIPHEYLGGATNYLVQQCQLFEKMVRVYENRLGAFKQINRFIQVQSFDVSSQIVIQDPFQSIWSVFDREYRMLTDLFEKLQPLYENQILLIKEQQAGYQLKISQIEDSLKTDASLLEQQHTLMKRAEEIQQDAFEQFKQEENKMYQYVRDQDEQRRAQAIFVTKAYKIYEEQMIHLKDQRKDYLNMELKVRQSVNSLLKGVKELEENRIDFQKQLIRDFNHTCLMHLHDALQYISNSNQIVDDCSHSEVQQRIVYHCLSSGPELISLKAFSFNDFRTNLYELYEQNLKNPFALIQSSKDAKNQSKAPANAIGLFEADFDFIPVPEEHGSDAIPLKSGKSYWMLDYVPGQWSRVAPFYNQQNQVQQNTIGVVPSDFLKPIVCYNQYSWQGVVLQVCGGSLPSKEVINEKEEKLVRFKCEYEYQRQYDDELYMGEGDKIDLIRYDEDGWGFGQNQSTNLCGLFPLSYCVEL